MTIYMTLFDLFLALSIVSGWILAVHWLSQWATRRVGESFDQEAWVVRRRNTGMDYEYVGPGGILTTHFAEAHWFSSRPDAEVAMYLLAENTAEDTVMFSEEVLHASTVIDEEMSR